MQMLKRALFTILLLLGLLPIANATHLVGGEMTYRFLGQDGAGNNRYEITLYIYQDCLTGLPDVIAQDNPAYIGVFLQNGANVIRWDSISSSEAIPVPLNFSNECVNNPPPTCLRRTKFVKTYTLPPSSIGYRVIYSRCCRNETINNIQRPGEVGATYFCQIPPTTLASNNNSARFKYYPPQIICINNPLVYDHSAVDPDADSLSYEICDSYPGGSRDDSKPEPYNVLPSPLSIYSNSKPSPSYGYRQGYSASKPMGGNPLIQIDPKTGLMSGTPNLMGRYVVSVCCHEWRNGVIINTIRREFQFVVTNCSKAVVADIPQFSNEINTYIVDCKDKTVGFVNRSTGGFSYFWDLGVPGATSTDFQPVYTYPDTGTYTVKLIVNKGSTCPDSIDRLVKIYPTHTADFKFDGLLCPNTPMQFTDLSEATYKPIVAWNWNFGDWGESTEQNPKHSFNVGGDYNVRLISSTIKGCVDTAYKTVKVEKFVPFAGNDTIIVKGESINFKASGGIEYTWKPADRLNLTNVFNPTGYYPDTGRYNYVVHIKSANDCEGDAKINVWVVNQASLFVPSAFSPNGDGRNDYLKVLSVGYAKVNYFRVFNRFGEAVFQTNKILDGWDGRYKGQLADVGTYFWVLSVTDRNGKEESIKGDVTLIR